MLEIKLHYTKRVAAERWCCEFVGPRRYYLHNKVGGTGWEILSLNTQPILRIEDEKQGLLAMIKFSERL